MFGNNSDQLLGDTMPDMFSTSSSPSITGQSQTVTNLPSNYGQQPSKVDTVIPMRRDDVYLAPGQAIGGRSAPMRSPYDARPVFAQPQRMAVMGGWGSAYGAVPLEAPISSGQSGDPYVYAAHADGSYTILAPSNKAGVIITRGTTAWAAVDAQMQARYGGSTGSTSSAAQGTTTGNAVASALSAFASSVSGAVSATAPKVPAHHKFKASGHDVAPVAPATSYVWPIVIIGGLAAVGGLAYYLTRPSKSKAK